MRGSPSHTGLEVAHESGDPQRRGEMRDDGDLLTADEVAVMLRMTKAWVYAQTRAGSLPHLRLGRYRRYRRATLLKWLASNEARGL